MKKLLVCLLVLAMTVSLLAACGPGGSDGPSQQDPGTQSPAASPDDGGQAAAPAGDGGTVVAWVPPDRMAFFEKVVPEFTAQTGIEVELVEIDMIEGDYKHALDGPAGIGPDIMAGPHNDVGDKSTQGMYAPINLSAEARAYISDEALDACTFEGSLYVVPQQMSTNLLIYNKDLVPTPPDTWDDLMEIINDSQFDNGGDGSLGFLANLGDFYNSAGFIWAAGGYMYGNNNTDPSDIGLNSEGAVQGAAYVQQLFNLMPQGMADRTSANDLMLGLFTEGKVGVMVNGTGVLPTLESAGVNYGLARMPKLPNGEVIANYSGFGGMAISGFAPNPELATQLLEFVVRDEYAKDFFELTGGIPTNKKFLAEESANNEVIKAFDEQIAHCVPMVKIIEGNQTWDPMHAAMGSLATGTDPKAALDTAVQQVEDNIAALNQ